MRGTKDEVSRRIYRRDCAVGELGSVRSGDIPGRARIASGAVAGPCAAAAPMSSGSRYGP
jgi:hypothetical protein